MFVQAEEKKLWNRMRAKVNRLCSYTKTGKLQVSPDVHKMWMQTGAVQNDLVQMMVDANGNRDPQSKSVYAIHFVHCTCMLLWEWETCNKLVHLVLSAEDNFLKSVEVYKESIRFRQHETQGGFYSETEMKKPVSEGGCGFSAYLGPNAGYRDVGSCFAWSSCCNLKFG